VGISEAMLGRAAKLSAASLYEAAGRKGCLPAKIKPLAPSMRACGPAYPVRCAEGNNLPIHQALASARSGDVLVVSVEGDPEFGFWGEVMATAAIARGVAGIILNGGVRDSLRLIDLGLPTFSENVSIRGTAKDLFPSKTAVGEPVCLGDAHVCPGDLVLGDADGVVVLAPEVACVAIPAAEQRDLKELKILDRIRNGALTLDIYKLPVVREIHP